MKRNLIFIVAGGIILIVVGLFVYFIKSGKIIRHGKGPAVKYILIKNTS